MSNPSDFVIDNGVLKKYSGPGGDVVVPEGVKSIAGAFRYRSSLTSITLPESVTRIGDNAFRSCKNLTSITLPESVTRIGVYAFESCSSLTSITLPESLKSIGADAFSSSGLTNIALPESVTSIVRSTFWGCKNLTSITLPKNLTRIGDFVFYGCSSLTSITLPKSLTRIGDCVFNGCSALTSITLPESLTSIGNSAFYDCKKLTSIAIPEGVTSIGKGAFKGCSGLGDSEGFVIFKGILFDYLGTDKSVSIPHYVTRIGDYAFLGCKNLTSITLPESVTSIGDRAFTNCRALASITIPEGVTSIGSETFYGCSALTSITLPESLTSIGVGAFQGCENLTSITIPDSMTAFPKDVFSINNNTCINISDPSRVPPALRPNTAIGFAETGNGSSDPHFASYSKYIKANAEKLADAAMANPTLLSLMTREKLIPDKVVDDYIEAAQKTKDAGLISLMLEYKNENVTPEEREKLEKKKDKEQDTVIERQFARTGKEGIGGLNIAVTGDLETFINRNEFKQCISEKGAKLATGISSRTDYLIMNDPNSGGEKSRKAKELGIEIISERKFNVIMGREFIIKDNDIVSYAGPGGKVVVPEGIKYIRARAFCDCETVTEIVLPDGLKRIGNRSFAGCQNLLNINLPDGVTSIGEEAFFHCDSLTDLFIPRSVKKISGYFVFSACPKLTLHVEEGSFAESYAKEHGIKIVAI